MYTNNETYYSQYTWNIVCVIKQVYMYFIQVVTNMHNKNTRTHTLNITHYYWVINLHIAAGPGTV